MKDHLRRLVGGHEPLWGRNVAREYLQARILGALQRTGAMTALAFQGGTCLRFLFGLPRYSEDLDFTREREPTGHGLRDHLRFIRTELSAESYDVDLRVRDRGAVHSALVRFPGDRSSSGWMTRRWSRKRTHCACCRGQVHDTCERVAELLKGPSERGGAGFALGSSPSRS